MFNTLPTDARAVLDWEWAQFAPYFADLEQRELSAQNTAAWLADWSRLDDLLSEVYARLHLAHDRDTRDEVAEQRYFRFLETILPPLQETENRLRDKLLAAGQVPAGMDVPLRRLRAAAAIYRQENIPLSVQLHKLGARYQKIVGAQTAVWDGEELPLPRLRPYLSNPDRAVRERAWRLAQERRLADKPALDALWQEMLPLRRQVAAHADCADYREFVWQMLGRFDYTPQDAHTFHDAIAAAGVPAATRIYERHRRRAGLSALRPWDLSDGEWGRPADPPGVPPLRPYRAPQELLAKSAAIFAQLDPQLGNQFQTLIDERLLDVENRVGKAPGGYCTYFAVAKRPFIFMNAVGLHDDVQTMLHEAGHAFHAFAHAHLPYHPQRQVPMEFNEVGSMGMELLTAPYLDTPGAGGDAPFYTPAEAARARIEHLERMILFWPYMAVVDAFQHWVYTSPAENGDPAACDRQWAALWARYLPGVSWDGLEATAANGWQRKLHIFQLPFYYIEYGLAALGAAQLWRGALADRATAVKRYRAALALGGTVTLPELFAAAGARFAFDEETVGGVVRFLETQIAAQMEIVAQYEMHAAAQKES